MKARLRRIVLPLVASVMLLPIWGTGTARAEVDYITVADAIIEHGYYVDSKSKLLRSDAALDVLRSTLERSEPAYVAVFPASVDPNAALEGLMKQLDQKGTYVVLAGRRLRAKSNTIDEATLRQHYVQAVKSNPGRPDRALIALLRLLPTAKAAPLKTPEPTTLADAQRAMEAGAKEAAEKKDDGGFPLGYLLGGLGLLAVIAAGFVLLLRRKGKSKPAAGAGAQSPAAGGGPADAPGA
ncbi:MULTISPECIES: hypothetical protein [Thermomonospora]|uniref:Uncharacterized protein n=1 Tax=Thermomonospora curvata (strain ATCC 19995 / DSM 43183 / JCM 3096 / KCTC 9072 / NBRC 15933 / NCIMB 10081 / Henssen B9) TaxID=471852 RepID=D1A7K3_THECD|nr:MULTISPECIES: hypothetical protein [Thermomonospora]ACY96592.1 hypothetical protein Tcur_1006 [Thermomonospora curvata DSM 43183]PKK15400.1 MAG: hypothetical protein BUE48_004885 [Thermomonospora sp. CIF 1]